MIERIHTQRSQDRRFSKISPATLDAIISTLIFGLVAQGMGIFNKYSWHDDISSLFLMGDTITSGRWMLHVLGEIEVFVFGDGHFSLPVMNGLFSLLCIGISAGLIVSFMRIRSRLTGALLGGIMAVFPMVTALFSFMFAAPYDMLAMLMMTAGGVLISQKNSWWKKVLGCLLGGCSLGIYQAFLPLLLTVILLANLREVAEGEGTLADFLRTLLIQAICVAGVMAIYVAGSRFFLNLYGLKMNDYMGLNEAGSLPLTVYLERALRAYREYFLPTRGTWGDMYPQNAYDVYYCTLGLNLVLGGTMLVRTWKRGPVKAVMLLVLLALYPLGCNFIFVMSETVHSLMVYGQVMHFVLLAWMTDRMPFEKTVLRRGITAIAAAALGLISVMYIRYDNECYLKTAFQQQEAISWNTALITRIKSIPGYRDELPVAWVRRKEMEDKSLYRMEELEVLTSSGYNEDIQDYLNDWAWDKFLRRWCGFAPYTADGESVEDWPKVRAMPCYPEDGSIQIVNDVIVVKFAEGSEEDGAR